MYRSYLADFKDFWKNSRCKTAIIQCSGVRPHDVVIDLNISTLKPQWIVDVYNRFLTDKGKNYNQELQNGKALDIPIVTIKVARTVISPYLTTLYNSCFASEIFPKVLKISKITPIHKKRKQRTY